MHWSFMSGSVSRSIGMWRGNSTNITADYRGRVQPFANGSMALSKLRLQDAGFYVLTVTEEQGSSRDLGFVLKVTEVLYEDLQYLSVSALALACVAALLMFTVWLLEKLYRRIRAWKRQKRMPETDVTELQPL
ncbi:V-set and transmembrane domain-containing protein 5 [Eucyclogobius newberryi]|uniref:V-set and transmembrane domain-containing protein 5 n=1 Tax=Eucyclogobius newberryi TaxID=166745 RepID=UPI003B591132